MNVTGRNLGAACKLIYQTSRVGENDKLFLQEEILGEIFIYKRLFFFFLRTKN